MIDVDRIYTLNFDRCGMVGADDKRLFALQAVAAAVREECAAHFDKTHRELWCPQIAEEIRKLEL
jgi:hypothetical protein